MKIILLFAGFLALIGASRRNGGNVQEQLLFPRQDPLASSLSDNHQHQHLYKYLVNALSNQRNHFRRGNPRQTTTVTVTSISTSTVYIITTPSTSSPSTSSPSTSLPSMQTFTSTSTSTISVTCTVSTTACAAGRRRRHLLSGLLEHQREEIQPSAVNPIEITSVDPPNIREGREVNPWLADDYFSLINQGLAQLEPSTNPSARQLPNFLNPVVAIENAFSAFVPSYLANLLPSLASSAVAVRQQSTGTTVICTYTFTTYTSTPCCSTPGTLLQCPAY